MNPLRPIIGIAILALLVRSWTRPPNPQPLATPVPARSDRTPPHPTFQPATIAEPAPFIQRARPTEREAPTRAEPFSLPTPRFIDRIPLDIAWTPLSESDRLWAEGSRSSLRPPPAWSPQERGSFPKLRPGDSKLRADFAIGNARTLNRLATPKPEVIRLVKYDRTGNAQTYIYQVASGGIPTTFRRVTYRAGKFVSSERVR